MRKRIQMLVCLLLLVIIISSCAIPSTPEEERQKLALIRADSAESDWFALESGAMRAAKELDVQIVDIPRGMSTDDAQTEQIRQAITDGCSVILLEGGPVSSDLREDVNAAGVKLVYMNSPEAMDAEAVVMTDHRAAGQAAGEAMLAALEEMRIRSGEIAVLRIQSSGEAVDLGEAGFREALEGENYILTEKRYDPSDPSMAETFVWDCLTQGVVGIFADTAEAAVAAADAVKAADRNVAVVGFGASEALEGRIKEGTVRAALAPDYDAIGYESVKLAVSMMTEEPLASSTKRLSAALLKSDTPVTPDYKIALILEERMDPYWEEMEAGAIRAAAERGCEIVSLSPDIQDELEQMHQIWEAVAAGYHAIVASTGNAGDVVSALQDAVDAGVKVICVDSGGNLAADAFVYTDHEAAGRAAAEHMLAELEARGTTKGNVGIVGVNTEMEETLLREKGFREVFEGTQYTLLETGYCEGDAAKAHALGEQFFRKRVVGVFCCEEGATTGVGYAAGAARTKALLIGFDTSDVIRQMIKEGILLATISENPDEMGYYGVQAACEALNGGHLGDGAVTGIDIRILTAEVLEAEEETESEAAQEQETEDVP